MKIVVIDGQSGRLGAQLIEALASRLPMDQHQLIAIGTNSLATSAMLKAGAQQGATGENPVLVACRDADIITGPIGIVVADALLGEITPSMAASVGQSAAIRVLLPVNRCATQVAGVPVLTRVQLIEAAVDKIESLCRGETP